MMFKTHLAFGFFVWLVLINLFSFANEGLFLIVVLVFSVFPDIDTPDSKVGRKTKPVSSIFNLFFGHRGMIHSLWVPVIIAFVFFSLGINFIAYGALVGYFSHLLIDGFTLMGVNLLAPFPRLHMKGFIRTGGFLEWVFFVLVIVGIIYLIIFL
jgi:inner membrane protein